MIFSRLMMNLDEKPQALRASYLQPEVTLVGIYNSVSYTDILLVNRILYGGRVAKYNENAYNGELKTIAILKLN